MKSCVEKKYPVNEEDVGRFIKRATDYQTVMLNNLHITKSWKSNIPIINSRQSAKIPELNKAQKIKIAEYLKANPFIMKLDLDYAIFSEDLEDFLSEPGFFENFDYTEEINMTPFRVSKQEEEKLYNELYEQYQNDPFEEPELTEEEYLRDLAQEEFEEQSEQEEQKEIVYIGLSIVDTGAEEYTIFQGKKYGPYVASGIDPESGKEFLLKGRYMNNQKIGEWTLDMDGDEQKTDFGY